MSHGVTRLTDQIKTCHTPQEALLLLAEAIDELRAQPAPADPWQQPLEWAAAPSPTSPPFLPEDVPVAERAAEIAALEAQLADEQDPQERKALKAKLWLLKNPGTEAGRRGEQGRRVSTDGTIKDLPVPDAGRMLVRRQWAQKYRLWEFFSPQRDEAEVTEAYAKGGPLWLYHSNRELCLELPIAARQMMVSDIDQDSVQEAREIGRDLLKVKEGQKLQNAVEAIKQISAARTGVDHG